MDNTVRFNIFHTGSDTIQTKIQKFECVESVSVQVSIPISEDKLDLKNPHRSAITVTIDPNHSFEDLDSKLENEFNTVWFKH